MKPIERSDILDYVTYGGRRDEIRAKALKAKSVRRIVVGEYFTFLFENRETVQYQIQEMVRVEQIVKEAAIAHEIKTYNELLREPGTLGCTLLIGIDDDKERDAKLTSWLGLNDSIYATMPSGDRIRPTWDPRQVGESRLSSVQYLTFAFGREPPVAMGISHPGVDAETPLREPEREALAADLSDK